MVKKKRLAAPVYDIAEQQGGRGEDPEQIRWDAYLIPGTQTMRNKLGANPWSYGISDRGRLQRAETKLAMLRFNELQLDPIRGDFDLAHMQAIHHHLFQDVYEWAGQSRTVSLTKRGHEYGPVDEIQGRWDVYAQRLADQDHLCGITDHDEFVDGLARSWGAINYAHAFREGNTRSQTLSFHQLSHEAGWELDVARLGPTHPESVRDQFISGRLRYQGSYNQTGQGNHHDLAQALTSIVSPAPQQRREISSPAPIPSLRPSRAGQGIHDQVSARVADLDHGDEHHDGPEF